LLRLFTEFDPRVLFKKDGEPVNPKTLDEATAKCLSGIKSRVVRRYREGNKETPILVEVEAIEYSWPDKLRALDQIAKISGMYAEAEESHAKQLAVVAKIMWQAVSEIAPDAMEDIIERMEELKNEVDIDLFKPEFFRKQKAVEAVIIEDSQSQPQSDQADTPTT
jgi:hypothetical protein